MAREHPLILQLDIAGNPCRWMTYEDAAYYKAKDLIAWTAGGSDFTIYGGNNRVTGEQSSMDLNTIIAVRGEIGDKGLFRIPTLTNRALFRRDQHICAYCGGEFSLDNLTRDHVQPSSRGGKDTWANVVSSCGGCNKYKDNRTPEEADMKLLYVPYAPNRAEYLILMNRTILADQMEFLISRVTKDSRLLNPIKLN
jgi:5-methylcytosine-specific restriction endonuclease McrA